MENLDLQGLAWVDTNGDGRNDVGRGDLNGDGYYELLVVDVSGNGYADVYAYDQDANGHFETEVWDYDLDGAPETLLFDLNGDRVVDSYASPETGGQLVAAPAASEVEFDGTFPVTVGGGGANSNPGTGAEALVSALPQLSPFDQVIAPHVIEGLTGPTSTAAAPDNVIIHR